MGCISDCKPCTTREANRVSIINPSFPSQQVTPGDSVTISFVIQSNDPLLTGNIDVCLYDRDTGACLDGVTIFMIPLMNSDIKTFSLTMPAKNWNLKLAVVDPPTLPLGSSICNDFLDFTIKAKFPVGSKFNCYNGSCIQNDNCTGTNCYNEPSCSNSCVPNPQECSSDKFNILGQCLAKNDVYMAIGLLALFIFISRR